MKTIKLLILAVVAASLVSCGVVEGVRDDPSKAIPRYYKKTDSLDPEGELGWFVPVDSFRSTPRQDQGAKAGGVVVARR